MGGEGADSHCWNTWCHVTSPFLGYGTPLSLHNDTQHGSVCTVKAPPVTCREGKNGNLGKTENGKRQKRKNGKSNVQPNNKYDVPVLYGT